MERLTLREATRCVLPGFENNGVNGCYDIPDAEWLEESIDRLAAIEDILGDEYDLDRLRVLVEADREGRCVVLPITVPGWGWTCRDGFPTAISAYYPFPSSVLRSMESGYVFGKTKDEAEAALAKLNSGT